MNIKILSRNDLEQILEMPRVIEGVEAVYKLKAKGEAVAWPLVEHHFPENAVSDIRSGGVFGEVGIHGAKLLNNFPANESKSLPVFTGVLMAFDSNTGIPLGVMDASYITCMRTGAAGAVSTQGCKHPYHRRSWTAGLLPTGRCNQCHAPDHQDPDCGPTGCEVRREVRRRTGAEAGG